jgi:PAS domain S-box-containing protein
MANLSYTEESGQVTASLSGDGQAALAQAVGLFPNGHRKADTENGGAETGGATDFRVLFEALPAAVYTTDALGRITFYNQAAAELWGCHPELGKSEWCGSWRLYWPNSAPMPHDQCPMAVTLKEKRPVRGLSAVAERPDGSRVHFMPYPTLLYDAAGAVIGAVNMLVDITDRQRADQNERRLASIVESSDDAIVSKDLNGIITSWNAGARRLFGYTAEEAIGKPITMLIPSDRENEEPGILERIRCGDRIDHYETVRRRKDGRLVEISLTVSPIKDDQGRIVGASKIARDITELKRAREQLDLLLREMKHRIKNLFSIASGVVALSARSAQAPDHIAHAIRERLSALSRAHELTLPDLTNGNGGSSQATTLHALLRTIVAPFVDPERDHDGRFVISGAEVPIGGSAVTSLALLLHEMAINAVKYGALSSANGRVTVDFAPAGSELVVTWREQGGPPVDGPPASEGFGSFLARATVETQFDGRISRDWRPDGLTVRLFLSLERLTQ